MVRHLTGWSPDDPEQPRNPASYPRRSYHVEVHGPRERLSHAAVYEDFDERDTLQMQSTHVYDEVRDHEIWYTHNNVTERTIAIYDSRGTQRAYNERSMTDSEFALCKFADPGFGNFDELWRHVEAYLQSTGFGFGTLGQSAGT